MTTTAEGLQRFHQAQSGAVGPSFDIALAELQAGAKRSHWIWYVLPQLRGLGHSSMAQRYGLADLAEARAFLADPLLRERLELVIAVVEAQLQRPGSGLDRLMGGGLDASKTISSLTLFEAAGLASATSLLDRLGRRCRTTQRRLRTTARG